VDHVPDLLAPLGPVQAKRMFGGHGIFLDGLMFALIADNVLYLKADQQSEASFTAEGLSAFSYVKTGKPFKMSYYEAPEHVLEDAELMLSWANLAFESALRAAAKKRRK